MSNSPLISYTRLSPNRTAPRKNPIDTITIHCVVGQATAPRIGEIFANPNRQASSNYGVGLDGKIILVVDEANRSWCTGTGNKEGTNDHRAITIEVASDNTAPFAVKKEAYDSMLNLCVDICKRNGKKSLVFLGSRKATEGEWAKGKTDVMYLTAHKWFNNTACPGAYLYERFPEIARIVTERLSGGEPITPLPTVELKQDSPIYRTASDALAHTNPAGTYKAGVYNVYKVYGDATNISKDTKAGGWIATADLDKKEEPLPADMVRITHPIDGYMTASNAVKKIDKKVTYKAGDYYVFRRYGNATNITKTKGSAGAWVANEDIN